MNWFMISAGIITAFTTIGHFSIGTKEYLKPMLQANIEPIPKQVMHAVFHYVSVYLILSTLVLLAVGLRLIPEEQSSLLVRFIAINYAFFAVWQIWIALTSKIRQGIIKMFQWVFFVVIAVLAWLGT